MRIVITRGAGFIGSAVVRHLIANTNHQVLVIDKLTYAGNLSSLVEAASNSRYSFARADICDRAAILDISSTSIPMLLCIWLRKATWIDPLTAQPNSSTPMLLEPTCCSKRH